MDSRHAGLDRQDGNEKRVGLPEDFLLREKQPITGGVWYGGRKSVWRNHLQK